MKFDEWEGFNAGKWQKEIDVRSFIQKNYTPYEGDSSFLASATDKTKKLWGDVLELYKKEKAWYTGTMLFSFLKKVLSIFRFCSRLLFIQQA